VCHEKAINEDLIRRKSVLRMGYGEMVCGWLWDKYGLADLARPVYIAD